MKNENTVDSADVRLDALLAGKPVEAGADFRRRVLSALADECIDAKLSEMPAEVPADFASRVMRAVAEEARGNVVAFPARAKIFRVARFVAAGVAAAVAVAFGVISFSDGIFSAPLSDRVELAVNADPELARLAASDDDEFSFDDVLAASQLLKVLNENTTETAEFFAYYEN